MNKTNKESRLEELKKEIDKLNYENLAHLCAYVENRRYDMKNKKQTRTVEKRCIK